MSGAGNEEVADLPLSLRERGADSLDLDDLDEALLAGLCIESSAVSTLAASAYETDFLPDWADLGADCD